MSDANYRLQDFGADISEEQLWNIDNTMFQLLLVDHTLHDDHLRQSGGNALCHNIFWATTDYEELGPGYGYDDQIVPGLITGSGRHIVMPRVLKTKAQQRARSKEMAEVFTPSWLCNAQNNLVDDAWFGRQNVFNTDVETPGGARRWQASKEHITFPEGKTWHDYVCDTRLEVTCGEAPYLVSRYDTTTGELIPVENRIGIIDRKLRVVSENARSQDEWLEQAKAAFMSVYGYEWQGDSLLLARESMLVTFMEYYAQRYSRLPEVGQLRRFANIISWNLWQMDGLRFVIPGSCHAERQLVSTLFEQEERMAPCEGCQKGDNTRHNGLYCIIRDWKSIGYDADNNTDGRVRFLDLMKKYA